MSATTAGGSANTDLQDDVNSRESIGTAFASVESSESGTEPYKFVHPQKYRDNYPKVTNHASMNLMSTIKGRLSEKAYEVFASTAVGHFLDMPETHNSSTILHYLLSRQIVRQDDGDPFCMHFGVGGHILRFGLKEFALATGLNFKLTAASKEDIDNPLPKCITDSPIMKTHFPGKKKVAVSELRTRFEKGDLKTCTDDENAKLALLFFVHVFLLGCQGRNVVKAEYCHLVDNLNNFNKFPWGLVSLRKTIRSFRSALVVKDGKQTKKSSVVKRDREPEKSGRLGLPVPYRVYGLSYALTAWALASIPAIRCLCGRVVSKHTGGRWCTVMERVSCINKPRYSDLVSLNQGLIVDCDEYELYNGDFLRFLGIVDDKEVLGDTVEQSDVLKESTKVDESSWSGTTKEFAREVGLGHGSDTLYTLTESQLANMLSIFLREKLSPAGVCYVDKNAFLTAII